MQFKPSYLFGLNELAGLAYVQNLGLLMKRAPGARFIKRRTTKHKASLVVTLGLRQEKGLNCVS